MTLEFTPEKTRIGWIGTGVMGSSMCGHLVAAGYRAIGLQPLGREGQAAGRERGQAGWILRERSPRRPTSFSRSSDIPRTSAR